MICKNCGFENEEYSEYCVNCGAVLADAQEYSAEDAYYAEGGEYYEGEAYDGEVIPEKKGVDVLGIVGTVLGGVSFLLCCCCRWIPFINLVVYISPIFSIAGIIVSAIGLVKAKKDGKKPVLSIIGLILSIVMTLVNIVSIIVGVFGLFGLLGASFMGMGASMGDSYYY